MPGQQGVWGGVARDNRLFINAVFWILRTGSPWRDFPSEYGDWKNTHRRFIRWRDKRIWEKLLEQLETDVDYEWLMIDSSHIKVHPHGAGGTATVTCCFRRCGVKVHPHGAGGTATRRWRLQKGAQYKAALGRGCAWYADLSTYHGRYRCARIERSSEVMTRKSTNYGI